MTYSKRGKVSKRHDSGDPEKAQRLMTLYDRVTPLNGAPEAMERRYRNNYRKAGTQQYPDDADYAELARKREFSFFIEQ